jgi:CheY-like chemotaxis protein
MQTNEIWIAEDNEDVRILLSRAFKRLNCDALTIFLHNGAELVKHFRSQNKLPKLLLLDLQMPIMTGLEALQVLKAEGCCGVSPVVIFSSLQEPKIVEAAYRAGAKLFLKKPDDWQGITNVARLCAEYADAIRDLSPGAIPPGALDVKRVLRLVERCDREISFPRSSS